MIRQTSTPTDLSANLHDLLHEVHDLWPLSPMELGGYSRWHPFIMLLQAAEDYACRHADAIVSILPKVREHLARSIHYRRLLASRRNGQGLDTTQGEAASRKVAVIGNGNVALDVARILAKTRADITKSVESYNRLHNEKKTTRTAYIQLMTLITLFILFVAKKTAEGAKQA